MQIFGPRGSPGRRVEIIASAGLTHSSWPQSVAARRSSRRATAVNGPSDVATGESVTPPDLPNAKDLTVIQPDWRYRIPPGFGLFSGLLVPTLTAAAANPPPFASFKFVLKHVKPIRATAVANT